MTEKGFEANTEAGRDEEATILLTSMDTQLERAVHYPQICTVGRLASLLFAIGILIMAAIIGSGTWTNYKTDENKPQGESPGDVVDEETIYDIHVHVNTNPLPMQHFSTNTPNTIEDSAADRTTRTKQKHDNIPGLDNWIAKMQNNLDRPIGQWYRDSQVCGGNNKKHESSYSCTPSGYTWVTGYRYITKNEGCELLKILGIHSILFAGDSFIRHLFAATKLVLTGDYEEGGIIAYPHEYHCSGEGQFSVKQCREYALHPGKVCHDSPSRNPIRLDVTKDDQVPLLNPADAKYDLIVWGIGNHNIRGLGSHAAANAIQNDPNPREGILNATIYSAKIFSKVCEVEDSSWMTNSTVFRNRVLWLPPHQRVSKHYYPDEHPRFIEQFFRESTRYLQRHCHLAKPIDTFSMTNFFLKSNTSELVQDGEAMSYDGVHYGRTVNVNKAQEMFKAIIDNVKDANI